MGARTPVTGTEHGPQELREPTSRCEDVTQVTHTRTIAAVMEWTSRAEAARCQGMQVRILLDRVERRREKGLDGLLVSNAAERAIRMAKVKASGCFRTRAGAASRAVLTPSRRSGAIPPVAI